MASSLRVTGTGIYVGNQVPPATPVWTRPADWSTLPTVTSSDEKIVGLWAVYPLADNFAAFDISGDFTVNWGDGTVENFSAGAAYHTYNYDDPDITNVCSRGYKTVVITITPQAGQSLTSIQLSRPHPDNPSGYNYNSNWLDISISIPNYTGVFGDFYLFLYNDDYLIYPTMLERAKVYSTGVNYYTNLFKNCARLQSVTLPADTSAVTRTNYMFYGCKSLVEVPLFDTSSVTTMASMFEGCYSLVTVPLYNTSSVTDISNMFTNCRSIKTIPQFNFSNVTTTLFSTFENCMSLQNLPDFDIGKASGLYYTFSSCFSLTAAPNLNTASATTMYTAFYDCTYIKTIPAYDANNVTNFDSTFSGASSLNRMQMYNIRQNIDINSLQFSANALNEVYTNLADLTGGTSKTINVIGNPGAANSNTAIANAKNWIVNR